MAEGERNERWRRAVAFLAGVNVAAAVGLVWIVTEGGEASNVCQTTRPLPSVNRCRGMALGMIGTG